MAQSIVNKVAEKINMPVTLAGQNTNQIKGVLEKYKAQIAQALPKHISVERIMQIATTVIAKNPAIAECTTSSLLGAVLQASIVGLELTPILGLAYLVPFYNGKTKQKEVQFQIGYRGFIELARRSKELKTLMAECVYENDRFEYELGLEPKLKHIPFLGERGELLYVYAAATFVNGGNAFVVLTKQDVMKYRSYSKTAQAEFSIWEKHFEEMAKKTAIRRLAKLLPMSVEYKTFETDNKTINAEDFKDGELILENIEEPEIIEVDGEMINPKTGEILNEEKK